MTTLIELDAKEFWTQKDYDDTNAIMLMLDAYVTETGTTQGAALKEFFGEDLTGEFSIEHINHGVTDEGDTIMESVFTFYNRTEPGKMVIDLTDGAIPNLGEN